MQLNHVLIQTNDLDEMSHFLTRVIGLEQRDRPQFFFKGAWFYSDNKPLVHVVESSHTVNNPGKILHFALEGADYNTLISTLKQEHINYSEEDVPAQEELQRQVFVMGPEGLIVEMLFPLRT